MASVFDDPIFKPGDVVTCLNPSGYSLTEGKDYEVVEYQARDPQPTFTWPAYVRVIQNNGGLAFCHAHRFKLKEAT